MLYEILGIIQLVILLLFLGYYLKKQGVIIFVDQIKIMFLLWIITLILYDLRLSTLYNPTNQINIIVCAIWGSFLILSKFTGLKEEDIHYTFKELKDREIEKRYFNLSNLIFIVAAAFFFYNVYKHGLAIAEENKIDKQAMDHYSGYIVYMLVLVAEIKYILLRNFKRWQDLVIFILSFGILLLTLNRGPIAFLFISLGLYEVFNFINIKERLSSKMRYLTYGGFILLIAAFIWFFGFVGNLRMEYVLENVYERTLWEHYGVGEYMPSGLLWVYIYLTSPLENVAFSLGNQVVNHAYFNNLFYPFVKFFANIIGKGDEYKVWLLDRATYIPYLEKKVGLNAGSFIPEAFQDLGFIGLAVYLLMYMALAYLSISLIKKRVNMSSISKILIYTNVTSLLLWSVFVNSFKMPILLLNIMLLLAIEYDYKQGYSKRLLRIIKR
ncbi:hypothetical protein [Clostridium sp.]|uniref:hypothetical protein n=1 Tax=Clostridium sp. TaxID=1506 RepID=UPI002FCB4843